MEQFQWKHTDSGAMITGCNKNDKCVIIPAGIEGRAVTEIAPKAFLRCKQLREITHENDKHVGIGFLRAAAMMMGAAELFEDIEHFAKKSSEQERNWLNAWDNALLTFLREPDLKGFRPMWAGGEEDYESEKDLPDFYENQRRCQKAEFSYLRLRYDAGLSDADRERLYDYIREHSKGCAHEEAWQIIGEQHKQEKEYYRILHQAGGISRRNMDAVLLDMDRYGADAEITAFVLGCRNGTGPGKEADGDSTEEDFFSKLML
ncbi:MAG: hypothetical protein GX234_11485 [Clostridiales bacterium]|nr:hypothetical protein [Clostridiales bacterium]